MRTLFLLTVALFIAGCSSMPDEPSSEGPISLELRCERCNVAVGEEVPIHVILRNTSDRPVRIVEPKHNIFSAFVNELSRDGKIIDGDTVVGWWLDDPYFYYSKPFIRDGESKITVTLTEEHGLIDLPPGLEWEGILGTTMFTTYEDRCEAETVYTEFEEPGVYTVRVRYRMDSRNRPAYRLEEGWEDAVSKTPALDVVSNALVITITEGPVH